MAEHVADGLEGLAVAKQVNGQRVPQYMGASTRCLYARFVELARQPAVDLAAQWTVGRPAGEEDLLVYRGRTFLAQVLQDGLTHRACQRQLAATAGLGCEDGDLVVRPVDAVES